MKRLPFVDNFDSFTYNVVHLLASQGAQMDVLLNDDERLADGLHRYGGLVVGPGPGSPAQKPRMMHALQAAIASRMPVFGVCLGLQAIGECFGGNVVHAPAVMHGKTSPISHDGSGVFAGLPSPFTATRYHSLCVDPATLPNDLLAVANSADGVVQGIRHRTLPVHGVQFHPESILSEYGDRLVRNFLDLVVDNVPAT
jgi:anthranilate synthase/aminodeoxychorismate synthase-like glutamine amidotransferase